MNIRKPLVIAIALALAGPGLAQADQVSDLKAQMEAMQRQMDALKAQLDQVTTQVQTQKQAQDRQEQAGPASGNYMRPGNDLIFQVGGGAVQIYGHADVSFDVQTNGMNGFINNGQTVTGKNGWVSDVSSNLSYFGVRGSRSISDDLTALFQLEGEIAYAATPGASDQAPDGTAQKYSLGSRNSFVGIQSAKYGAVKLGKEDTPYKTATARMDPFASTPGDYNAIMGNSGGDNRAEFDARLAHSVWYESPNMSGFNVNVLYSPGQNRSTGTGLYAQGEPDCTGGNSTAGLNGNNGQPNSCLDGSFDNAFSAALIYQSGPLYAIAAFERHSNVNRTGDEIVPGTIGIRNESAYKLGVQYAFLPTNTTVNFIVERLKRDAISPDLDERTHTATWLALTQKLTPFDDLNLGWAHAGRTPGQPDQSVQDKYGNPNGPGPSDNSANLYAIGLKHYFLDKRTTAYLMYAGLHNGYWGHYSLGAGGHGLPTRNYVGDKFIGGCQQGGVCGPPFTGYTAQGVSFGLTYDF